jgi:hypothetical protein
MPPVYPNNLTAQFSIEFPTDIRAGAGWTDAEIDAAIDRFFAQIAYDRGVSPRPGYLVRRMYQHPAGTGSCTTRYCDNRMSITYTGEHYHLWTQSTLDQAKADAKTRIKGITAHAFECRTKIVYVLNPDGTITTEVWVLICDFPCDNPNNNCHWELA